MKYVILLITIFLLISCSNSKVPKNTIFIINEENNKIKLIVDSDPSPEIFYDMSYSNINNFLFNPNYKIYLLRPGSQEIKLTYSQKNDYAFYFIYEKEEINILQWKFLENLSEEGKKFIIYNDGIKLGT